MVPILDYFHNRLFMYLLPQGLVGQRVVRRIQWDMNAGLLWTSRLII